MSTLAPVIEGSPFQAYAYGYPHKSAYRPFARPIELSNLWEHEPRDSLFLYLHIPFCEFRCGFCNLFTKSNPAADLPGAYIATLKAEAMAVCDAIGNREFARLAIGGGTPTFLATEELAELFSVVALMAAQPARIPTSVEASPATLSSEKAALLRESGVDRLSLGVQSFSDVSSKRLGRPQTRLETEKALRIVRDCGFPILNIDLIYGGEGQTREDWLIDVREALAWQPEEIYLYPLYVRPLTGLGRRDRDWDDQRLLAYRAARELLLAADYEQISLRMFRGPHASDCDGPVYCCQEDGMVGLGCGARSYTRTVHYSTEYAVGQAGVRAVLADYISRSAETFGAVRYGYQLPPDDQRRRYVILSLLQRDGLSRAEYSANFEDDVLSHLPQLTELEQSGLAELTVDKLKLTVAGMERSDAIGPWLYSQRVRDRMGKFELT